jgi:phosphoribosylpyrophosphate synthetase
VDHLFASPVLVSYFRELELPDLTVVSPDAGGVERARFFAKKLEVPLAIVDKRRTDMNVTEVMNVIGDVRGRTCLILDDIIDTAGTLVGRWMRCWTRARRRFMRALRIRCFRARRWSALRTHGWSSWS